MPQKLWFSPQGTWPFLSNIRHCPVSYQRLAFERLHVSESIYLSPTFKWEDTKGAFFPEHPLEQCLNWLLWLSMMWLAFIQLSPNSGHVFPTASTVKPRSNPTHYYQACNWFDFFHTCLSKKKFFKMSKRRETAFIHACNKLCKKFNPHRFAALQNCSWVYVANDSLPWQSCIHIDFYHNDNEIDDFLFSSNKEN